MQYLNFLCVLSVLLANISTLFDPACLLSYFSKSAHKVPIGHYWYSGVSNFYVKGKHLARLIGPSSGRCSYVSCVHKGKWLLLPSLNSQSQHSTLTWLESLLPSFRFPGKMMSVSYRRHQNLSQRSSSYAQSAIQGRICKNSMCDWQKPVLREVN